MDASETMGAVYLLVETEINLIRPITSVDDLLGFPAGDSQTWTADCADFSNLTDGSMTTNVMFEESNNVLTIDLKETYMVTGFYLNGSTIKSLLVEYSTDGVNWEGWGVPAADEIVCETNADYAVAIYDYVEARYLRLSFDFSFWYKPHINELEVYTIESTDPTIYATTGENNVISAKISHKASTGSSSCDLAASFPVYTTVISSTGYNVTVAADNSLVAAYNTANGTAYETLPSENLLLENTSLTIAADEKASSDEVKVSLQGDLSALTAKNGYLVPLKLATSTSGAVTSASRGVVYLAISVENNMLKAISSAAEVTGTMVDDRSAWSAKCDTNEDLDLANLFDGNLGTQVIFTSGSNNTFTTDMARTYQVTGLYFRTYRFSYLTIEYSLDGTDWSNAGTVTSDSDDYYFAGGTNDYVGQLYYVAFAAPLEARYIRLSFDFNSYYPNIYEFKIYQSAE